MSRKLLTHPGHLPLERRKTESMCISPLKMIEFKKKKKRI